jgi:hypothetical protein
MGNPSRAPNGISTASPARSTLWNYTAPDPTKNISFFDDFVGPQSFPIASSGLAAASNSTWTVTVTEAGAGNAASSITNAHGGILQLVTDAASGDTIYAQKAGEFILPASNKKIWFKAKLKIASATLPDLVVGLQVTDTTPLDVTDGIYFLKASGAATVDLICRKDASTGSTSASAITSFVADTYLTLGFEYDGLSAIKYFVDDVHKGTLAVSSSYLPDTTITMSIGIKNSSAAANTLSVDYLFAAMER